MTTDLDPARQPDQDLDAATTSPAVVYGGVTVLVLLIAGAVYLTVFGGDEPRSERGPAVVRDPTAAFTDLQGGVKVKPTGVFYWDDARSQLPLHDSDLVRTGVRSTAEITFRDETVVNVRPESLITIQSSGPTGSSRRQGASWLVSSGEVNFRRQRAEGSTEVRTPTLRSTLSEMASANIRVEASGDSDIRLFSGRGRVETTTGETVELAENEGLRVDAEGQAGPKVKLPATPSLRAPGEAAELPEALPPRDPNRLEWSAVADATGYHVVVSADPSFAEELLDRSAVASPSLELPRLAKGRYHWRVAALGAGGAEGAFSPARSFAVVDAPSGPPLQITDLEVRGNIAHVRGSTRPGSIVWINGHEVPVQRDGGFDEFVTLVASGPQALVVRSLAADGGVSELERRVAPGR